MTSLYSLVAIGDAFRITRFDADLNPESTYELDSELCTCPAGTKSTCRHRKMLPLFQAAGHVNDGFLLDWDTRLWRSPPKAVAEIIGMVEEPLLGKAQTPGCDYPTCDCDVIFPDGHAPTAEECHRLKVTATTEFRWTDPEPAPPATSSPAQAEVASPPPPTPQPTATGTASASAGEKPLFRRRVT